MTPATPVLDPPARSSEPSAGASTASGPTLRSSVRRGRGPVVVAVALVLAGGLVGLLSAVGPSGYLDPDAYDPRGSRAVAELLREGGVQVERVRTPAEVEQRDAAGATLVVPRPAALARTELERLAGRSGRLVVVTPTGEELDALAVPAVPVGEAPVEPRQPACSFEPAQRAGVVELGGVLYEATDEAAVGCYSSGGDASLLVLPEQDAVVLGSGALLTNDALDEQGNAALALALLGSGDRVLWLVPDPAREVPAGEQRPLTELLPDGLKLAVVQLAVALVVLALWRARRLGRVVEEPLPVVVRAAEAVEGRGRLYRAAGARESAAEALRAGVRDRVVRRLGLPRDGGRTAVVAGTAARTGQDPATVDALLYGAPPADDAAMVRLAGQLRGLERAVSPASTRPTTPPSRQTERSPEVAGP